MKSLGRKRPLVIETDKPLEALDRPPGGRHLEGEKENKETAGGARVPGWLVIAALFAGWLLFVALLWFFHYLPASRE